MQVPAQPTRSRGSRLELRLLDGFVLLVDGHARDTTTGPSRLLAYLGLQPDGERSQIAGTLWPEVSEEHAQASLRTTAWRIRAVHPGLLVTLGRSMALHPSVRVDVRELVTSAARVRHGANAPEAGSVLTRTGSELLPGWYEDWVLRERERLRQLKLHALEELSLHLLLLERFGEAVDVALRALAAEPLRESANRLLIRIHLTEGNRIEARRHYDRYAELLLTELGELPGDAVTGLLRRAPARPGPGGHAVDPVAAGRPVARA